MAYSPPPTGAVLEPLGTATTSLVPQYTAEGQDATGRGGLGIGSGSLFTGQRFQTTVTTTGNPTLTSLIGGSIAVAATGGPSPSGPYFAPSGLCQINVATSGGNAVLSYTGTTATTYTGLAIVSGTGTWTVAVGATVSGPQNAIPDIAMGASLTRGVGGTFGVTDWKTVLNNTENDLAGLVEQNYGFVFPVYSDVYSQTFQWNTHSGTGVSTVTTGSPSVNNNSGAGGALASSVLLGSTGAVAGDNRVFRRMIVFFYTQSTGATVTVATTGKVVSSGAISTAGSGGYMCWDSGDLGYYQAGTGFTATAGTVSGGTAGGVVCVGVLYLQNAGTNGICDINIARSGTATGDWASTTTGFTAFMQFLTNNGWKPRRIIHGDEIGNDNLQGSSLTTAITNLTTINTALKTATPNTEIVQFGIYNIGTSGTPGVGNATWVSTWLPALQNSAVTNGCTFIDLYAGFGDLSYTGDPYGLTLDNVHCGVGVGVSGLSSTSGRNGQQTLAEYIFDKLATSKDFALSGQFQTGVAADGSIVDQLADGAAGGISTQWRTNASDANPVAAVQYIPGGFTAAGLYLGLGGSTAPDTVVARAAAAVVSIGSALKLVGLTGAATASRLVGGTTGGPPSTGGAQNSFVAGDLAIAATGQTLSAVTVGTVTACTNVSTTVTYTMTAAQIAQLSVGQRVTIGGITGFTNNPNGTWTVATIPSSTTFTAVVGTAPTGSYVSGGTVTGWFRTGQVAVAQIAPGATPTINSDTTDVAVLTGLAANITGITVSGSPAPGQRLVVKMTDNGTARTITWGSSFAASANNGLPGQTVPSVVNEASFIWDAVADAFVVENAWCDNTYVSGGNLGASPVTVTPDSTHRVMMTLNVSTSTTLTVTVGGNTIINAMTTVSHSPVSFFVGINQAVVVTYTAGTIAYYTQRLP